MRTTDRRILIATAGTLGDLLPFVALGRQLTQRGHEVTIACATGLHPWVERSGQLAAAFDGDFGEAQAQAHAAHWNHWGEVEELESEARVASFAARLERNSRELARLAHDVDLLVTPTNCPEGRLVHELTGTPWLSAIFIPAEGLLETRPPDGEGGESDRVGAEQLDCLLGRLGLRSRRWTSWQELGTSKPALFACSIALGRAGNPEVHQTGFWFYEDPEWARWQPDPEIVRFMEGEAPLVLSFSSLPLEDPRGVLAVHVRAAQLLGRRLIVQQGWAGFSREMLPGDSDPDSIYMASFLPHDWFLSRAAALITHGGVGTLGRALRNRCPVLVEPYGNDQFFNALLVKRLGYGAAMHPLRLTAESLAAVLRDRVLSAEARQRVASAASLIDQEDGLGRACAVIDEHLGRSRGVA